MDLMIVMVMLLCLVLFLPRRHILIVDVLFIIAIFSNLNGLSGFISARNSSAGLGGGFLPFVILHSWFMNCKHYTNI